MCIVRAVNLTQNCFLLLLWGTWFDDLSTVPKAKLLKYCARLWTVSSAVQNWVRSSKKNTGNSSKLSSPYNRPGRSRGGVEVQLHSFFNLNSRWGGWSTPRPGRFTPGKDTRFPLYRRLGGPQGRSGRVRKISLPPGFDPRIAKPVASRHSTVIIMKMIILMTSKFGRWEGQNRRNVPLYLLMW